MTAALKLMTADEFLVWSLDQPDRWELDNGVPVRLMTGATRVHDRIVVNLIIDLGVRLRGKPCQPNTADVAARMTQGNVRRPDVTVDCGGPPDKSLESARPIVFFEVLSPSTRAFDQIRKLEEYKGVPSLRHVVLIDQDMALAWVWSRADERGEWSHVEVAGLAGEVVLAGLALSLQMTAIYEGLSLAG